MNDQPCCTQPVSIPFTGWRNFAATALCLLAAWAMTGCTLGTLTNRTMPVLGSMTHSRNPRPYGPAATKISREPPRTVSIVVELRESPAMRLPIAVGTSLRQAVALAQDRFDGQTNNSLRSLDVQPIGFTTALPSKPFANRDLNLPGTTRSGVADDNATTEARTIPHFADDECVVILRGLTRLFVPQTLVSQSPVGRVPLRDGDVITTVPLELIRQGAIWGEPSDPVRITVALTGPFCEPQSVEVSRSILMNNGWSDFFRAARLQELDGDPNIVVVQRHVGPWRDLLLSPVSKNFRDDDWEGTFRTEIPHVLLEGDLLDITRLDYLPGLIHSAP